MPFFRTIYSMLTQKELKTWNYKSMRKTHCGNLQDFSLDDIFFYMTKKINLKQQKQKEKNGMKSNYKLSAVRKPASGVKKQPTQWGNVKHTFARG